jgi:heme-degrading monooxygenase HmoA
MFITTTQWDTRPDSEMVDNFEIKAIEIAAGFESTKLLSAQENGGVIATRTWPTQEAADAWCTYVLALGATSALSEPYTP